ncbi:MAG TPA: hypothetical protein EYQ58_00480 [Candidatus Poseidoniales archaeon]|nr:hypothetical protein [Candidatus Poseidoniales archaeon]
MNAELIKNYSPRIQDAVDYIEGRRNRSPKRQWTPEQRKQWILRSLECPLCNEKYSKTNPLTKEHIHPTFLGGYERETNIIPLCEKCNFARNTVMIAALGTTKIDDIRNRWPAIKPSIQIFIIWCHASINGDEDALNQCSALNSAFSQERKIKFPFSFNESQTPTSPKEKLSLWKRAEKVGRNAMKSASGSIKSLKSATKNHQEVIGLSEKIVLQCQGQGCEQQLRIPSDHTGNFRCPKCKHEHLGTDSSPSTSKTSNAKIKMSTSKNTPFKEKNVSKKSKSKTKLAIEGFSTASRSGRPSLAMPADNRKVCDMLVFIESKRNICNNWVELKELMIASKFDSKTRTSPVHFIYQNSVDQEGDEIDWSKIEEPQVMVELMQKKALQLFSQRESLIIYNSDENRQKIKDYFNEIKEMLSIIEVKNTPKELNNNSPQKQEQEEPPVVEINAEKELQKEIPSHKIVAFRTKILEFLNSEKGPVNLQQINKKILIYMKSIGFNSNHVTEFLKLFDMPRGLKKAIEKHMGEEVIITGKHPKFIIQKKVS